MSAWRGLFFLVLGINALQDLKKQEILLVPTFVYGLVLLGKFLLDGGEAGLLLLSCLPGVFILALSLWTGGKIGLGDGWILLAAGLELGFFPTLAVLWAASLLAGMLSICILIRAGHGKSETASLPLVPFLFAAAVLWQSAVLVL